MAGTIMKIVKKSGGGQHGGSHLEQAADVPSSERDSCEDEDHTSGGKRSLMCTIAFTFSSSLLIVVDTMCTMHFFRFLLFTTDVYHRVHSTSYYTKIPTAFGIRIGH